MLNTIKALGQFQNPWGLLSDRAGLKHDRYTVTSRSGIKINIRPQTGDRFTTFETFGIGVYDRGLEFLQEGDTVIDIGANIGCFALAAAQRVGATGRVIAVEPEQNSFDSLKHDIAINAPMPIMTVQRAIANQPGTVNIHSPSRSTLFSSMFDTVDHHKIEGDLQTVESGTLENLMLDQTAEVVKLLKMDCEGAEHEIIASLTPSVSAKIHNMIIEFHQISGRTIENSIRKLKSLGYEMNFNHNYVFSLASQTN